MTVAVGVVAHVSRAVRARELAAEVGAEVLVIDDHRGERWCHAETLSQLTATGADWLAWAEDDAVPCPGFRDRLDEALADAGLALVSVYLGTGRWAGTSPRRHEPVIRRLIERADATGARWIDTDSLWHAVAVAVPARLAPSLLEHLRDDPHPTDQAATRWARAHTVPVRYRWPSLVDHDDGPRVVTASERPVPRRAWRVEV